MSLVLEEKIKHLLVIIYLKGAAFILFILTCLISTTSVYYWTSEI